MLAAASGVRRPAASASASWAIAAAESNASDMAISLSSWRHADSLQSMQFSNLRLCRILQRQESAPSAHQSPQNDRFCRTHHHRFRTSRHRWPIAYAACGGAICRRVCGWIADRGCCGFSRWPCDRRHALRGCHWRTVGPGSKGDRCRNCSHAVHSESRIGPASRVGDEGERAAQLGPGGPARPRRPAAVGALDQPLPR